MIKNTTLNQMALLMKLKTSIYIIDCLCICFYVWQEALLNGFLNDREYKI